LWGKDSRQWLQAKDTACTNSAKGSISPGIPKKQGFALTPLIRYALILTSTWLLLTWLLLLGQPGEQLQQTGRTNS
jgi:hypothetical protein